MAVRYAVATGNWSNTATWDGGTLPGAGDDVHANGFTVAIDQDISVNKISTAANAPALAGGGFTLDAPNNGARYITSSIEAGSTTCVIIGSINGFTYITGNIYGGTSVGAIGLYLNGTNSNNSHRPVITGNIYGGSAVNSHGLNARGDRAYFPTVYGNVFAGIVSSGISLASNQPANTVTVYGNVIASGANAITTGGNFYCFGTVTASNNFYGAQSFVAAYVSGVINNEAGNWGVYSPKLFVSETGTMEMKLNGQTPGDDILLYSANSFVGIPSGSDVRTGVVYGPSDDLTGTLAVPPSGSVALGVPVDNTVGTAIINVQDMGALLASYII
jgi:hypothetical protein